LVKVQTAKYVLQQGFVQSVDEAPATIALAFSRSLSRDQKLHADAASPRLVAMYAAAVMLDVRLGRQAAPHPV